MLETELKEQISNLVGDEASSFERVQYGYSDASRWTFKTERKTYFAKIGTTSRACHELRLEIAAYDKIRGDFMPHRVATKDHDSAPILILEDLSDLHWPPPWHGGQIEDVLAQITNIHKTAADLPTFGERHDGFGQHWGEVANDMEPFLDLGLVSESWLEHALPLLLEAESKCVTEGSALTHFDIPSDNICIGNQAVKFIDWNNACLGNPKLDLGFWLPSLAYEGGPSPESLLGGEPEIAACVSGFFASLAGLPKIENAPRVRLVQRQQLGPALSWVIRALDLPMPE